MSSYGKTKKRTWGFIAVILALILAAAAVVGVGSYYGWFENADDITDDPDTDTEVVYSRNILTWENAVDGFYISPKNGSMNSLENYITTDYLPVTGGMYLVVSCYGAKTASMRFVAMYDEYKNIIYDDNNVSSGMTEFLLNDYCAYVRVTFYPTSTYYEKSGLQLELSEDGTCTSYVAYGPVSDSGEDDVAYVADGIKVQTDSVLYGKTVAWVGTSITNGYKWCSVVNAAFNFNATNCGVSGTAMCYESDSSMCTTERLLGTYSTTTDENTGEVTYTGKAIPEDVEIIFIEAGTNDWARNWELGERQITYDDDYNIDLDIYTFYGACHQFFKNVTELFPDAVVIAVGAPFGKLADRASFTNSYGLLNNENLTTLDYGDCLVDVAGMWGFYGINMGRYMGINDNNIDEYIPDGLHLTTETAYTNAAKVIINNLLQIENLITV